MTINSFEETIYETKSLEKKNSGKKSFRKEQKQAKTKSKEKDTNTLTFGKEENEEFFNGSATKKSEEKNFKAFEDFEGKSKMQTQNMTKDDDRTDPFKQSSPLDFESYFNPNIKISGEFSQFE